MRALLAIPVLLVLALPAVAQAGRCGATCMADVSISGHAEPQPIKANERSEFKFTPQNNGPDGALGITTNIQIPQGLQIEYAITAAGMGCTIEGQFVQCKSGDFAASQQDVIRIKVRALKEGTYIARADVYAYDVEDKNGGNNQVSATLLANGVNTFAGRDRAGVSVRAADPQRVLKSGGVKVKVTPVKDGEVTIRGEVRTKNGRVKLASVQRGGKAGKTMDIFLGTTPGALSRIRSGLRSSSRLRTIIWVRSAGVTVRRELHLRR